MKYCFRYSPKCEQIKYADEVILPYDLNSKQNTQILMQLAEVMNKGKQCVVIDLTKSTIEEIEESYYLIENIIRMYDAAKVILSWSKNIESITDKFRNSEIKFFLSKRIDTWDKLYSCVKLGASDVIISSDLGFEMKKVYSFCKRAGVSIRVFPNIAQTSGLPDGVPHLHRFFIRPEDMHLYDDIIDVCEFYCRNEDQDFYYNVYTSRSWFGPLRDIVKGCRCDTINLSILPQFGENRFNCRHRCVSSSCSMCDTAINISDVIFEANGMIKNNGPDVNSRKYKEQEAKYNEKMLAGMEEMFKNYGGYELTDVDRSAILAATSDTQDKIYDDVIQKALKEIINKTQENVNS